MWVILRKKNISRLNNNCPPPKKSQDPAFAGAQIPSINTNYSTWWITWWISELKDTCTSYDSTILLLIYDKVIIGLNLTYTTHVPITLLKNKNKKLLREEQWEGLVWCGGVDRSSYSLLDFVGFLWPVSLFGWMATADARAHCSWLFQSRVSLVNESSARPHCP